MNKTLAKKIAFNNETEEKLTYQDLINLIESVKDLSGLSIINKELPREYLFNNIFKGWVNELKEKNIDLNSIVVTTYLNINGRNDKISLSSNGMILKNIIRECLYIPKIK